MVIFHRFFVCLPEGRLSTGKDDPPRRPRFPTLVDWAVKNGAEVIRGKVGANIRPT